MAQVKFNKTLDEEAALAASSQNPNTLYFTTDTDVIVLGGQVLDGGVRQFLVNIQDQMYRTNNLFNRCIGTNVVSVYVHRYSRFYAIDPVLPDSNYVFVGVAVRDSDGYLVVSSPTSNLQWLDTETPGGGTLTASLATALADKSGAANTLAQVTTYGSAVTNSTAIGYCHSFSRSDGTVGPGAGKWWLPSMGELNTIYTNIEAIKERYILENLGDLFQLPSQYVLCSSTECNGARVWGISSDGVLMNELKNYFNYTVIPVTRLGY